MVRMKLQKWLIGVCTAACLALAPWVAQVALSQEYPSKPITIYYGFEAGATGDLVTRAWATEAQKELKVSVVVTNHTGASGMVAVGLLARKEPDGYSLGVTPIAQLAIVPLMVDLSFDPLKNFTFLASAADNVGGICVKSDSPFKTLKDLIEYARKNPLQATYSTPGVGGPIHLCIEQLAQQAGVKFKHVPYKGGASAVTALLGGHVTFHGGTGLHQKYVKQGLWRMLAVTLLDKRDPKFPDIPTLGELGYKDLPANPYVVYASQGLPKAVAKKIETSFINAAQSAEFRKAVANLDLTLAIRDSAEINSTFQDTCRLYSNIVNSLGLAKKQ
jgi:tripartite-type tricarboxylate transporter receptor subunit TctC